MSIKLNQFELTNSHDFNSNCSIFNFYVNQVKSIWINSFLKWNFFIWMSVEYRDPDFDVRKSQYYSLNDLIESK